MKISPVTRSQVRNLQVGDDIAMVMGEQMGPFRKVVEITYRGVDVNGKAYVGFYTEFGENSRISGSVKEGRAHYIIGHILGGELK